LGTEYAIPIASEPTVTTTMPTVNQTHHFLYPGVLSAGFVSTATGAAADGATTEGEVGAAPVVGAGSEAGGALGAEAGGALDPEAGAGA
jgi:hypothetical protein